MARILVIWSPTGRELEHMQLDSLKRTAVLYQWIQQIKEQILVGLEHVF
jgi:hypothetical protein